VRSLREQKPELFGEKPEENNLENLYITLEKQRIEFKKSVLVDGRIEMIIPKEFEALSDATAALKYLSNDRPQYIYTNEDTTFGVSFSLDETAVESAHVVRDIIRDYTLKLNSGYRLINCGETAKNGVPCFSIITDAIDDQIWNTVFFIDMKNAILLGNINQLADDGEKWFEIFLQMIDSISEITGM
jgi:hypothetical protein